MNFVITATKQVKEDVERFKYEICFDPLSIENRKKRAKQSTSKKVGPRLADQKVNISINEMLVQAVRSGINQADLSMQIRTPLREPILPQTKLSTAVPPF